MPEGVFSASVNYWTGFLTDPGDPDAITEYFIRGPAEAPGLAAPPEPAPASPPEPALVPPPLTIQPAAPEPVGMGQR